MLVDLRMAELRNLVRLGNDECGTSFAHDVHPLWDDDEGEHEPKRGGGSGGGGSGGGGGGAPPQVPSPARMSMLGEREALRPLMWQDPRPSAPRPAVRLPDGSYTCTLLAQAVDANTNRSGGVEFCKV